MTFIEFLLEYYVYIVIVLIVLIIGVIGFLVDSKNKEKRNKKEEKVLNDNGAVDSNVINNQNVSSVNANGGVNGFEQGQNLQAGVQNDVQIGVQSGGIDNSPVTQTVNNEQPQVATDVMNQFSPEAGNVNPSVVNAANFNTGMNGQSVQPKVANMSLNTTAQATNNFGTEMTNGLNMGNGMQSQGLGEVVNPIPVNNVNNNTEMMGPTVVDSGIQNMQPNLAGTSINPNPMVSVNDGMSMANNSNVVVGMPSGQNMQTEVLSSPVNSIPVQNVNGGMPTMNGSDVMTSVNNVQSNSEPVNPLASSMVVNNVPVTNVVPTMDNNTVLSNGANIGQGVQPQMGINNNSQQVGMASANQVNGMINSNVQNTNVAEQNVSTASSQGNGVVLTSDNSQPFDISSMFANNQ